LRPYHHLSSLIDVAPPAAHLHRRPAVPKIVGVIVLRVDDELAVGVDIARAAADGDYGQPVRERRRLFELRRDLHLAPAIHVTPASVLSNQEKPAPLLARPGRLDAAA